MSLSPRQRPTEIAKRTTFVGRLGVAAIVFTNALGALAEW